jgi:hypothetical protein
MLGACRPGGSRKVGQRWNDTEGNRRPALSAKPQGGRNDGFTEVTSLTNRHDENTLGGGGIDRSFQAWFLLPEGLFNLRKQGAPT